MKNSDLVTELRTELDGLKAELAAVNSSLSHYTNERSHMMVMLRQCSFSIHEDLVLGGHDNTSQLFNVPKQGAPVTDMFGTDSAARYFSQIHDLVRQFRGQRDAPGAGWKRRFSSTDVSGELALRHWSQSPPGSWKFEGGCARAADLPPRGPQEYYLVSPREIIGPDEDFRIEYTARAEEEPKDLSVVVGAKGTYRNELGALERPESDGYCFAFGAMANQSTELQRCLKTIAFNHHLFIQPNRDHRCIAERVGGILRFSVDGKDAYTAMDVLPLCGGGRGHVSLYTCARNSVFSDIEVRTRPTCLTPETRQLIETLRAVVLDVKDGRSRFAEINYLGGLTFLVKDVTEVVEERQRLEAHKRQVEKMEAVLELAAATVHEMAQPLTVLLGYADLILGKESEVSPDLRKGLVAVRDSSLKLSEIVRRIGKIDKYRTKSYVGKMRIVDLEAASQAKEGSSG